MKVYFGNLPKDIDDAKLGEIVKPFGAATSAEVVKDRVTGASKGFAFVEFASDDEAHATINALNGKDMNGQAVVVNALQQKFKSSSGVNIDSEMANLIALQNNYAANAHVMSVVQAMMTSLMQVQL